jgi:N6-L-threonylcarbamoyladenine synthase
MSQEKPVEFPCLGVVLSGGHTALVLMGGFGQSRLVSETIDDAIGEAFDKVAKMLELPYPGGPQIESLAKKGNPKRFSLKPGKVKGMPLHFSFSGLKTAVLYTLKGQNSKSTTPLDLSEENKADISASFQHAALTDVVNKALLAAKQHDCRTLVFGGGVTNNKRLRELFSLQAKGLELLWPSVGLSLDNAAMIAGLGYHSYIKKGKGDPIDLAPATRIPFATSS